MGSNASSIPSEESIPVLRPDSIDDKCLVDESDARTGFRVLGIQECSPAAKAGFVSFFDFIIQVNGIRLDTKDSTLMELIASHEGRELHLIVYNTKAASTRELKLTPSRDWPGKGLLGVSIRFDSFHGAAEQLIHVLNVAPDSPAAQAGLCSNSDYLLGTPEAAFQDMDDLYQRLHSYVNQDLQCYVYNCERDDIRIVSIHPTREWKGDGILGAEVAHGILHQLPSLCRSTCGVSSGYIELQKEAKAATDVFLKAKESNAATEPICSEIAEGDQKSASSEDQSMTADANDELQSRNDMVQEDKQPQISIDRSSLDKFPISTTVTLVGGE